MPARILENEEMMQTIIFNAMTTRANFLQKALDPRRDIDDECGYPKEITSNQYRILYDREGIATRVNDIWPQESWAMDPELVENEDQEDTEFELAWEEFQKQHNPIHYMLRADELSGIGHYGIILLGLGDGKDLGVFAEFLKLLSDKGGRFSSDVGVDLIEDESR